MFWCIKKDEFTAGCKLCDKDINVVYMEFGALKQHSEKGTYGIFCSMVEACVAKQTGSIRKATIQGTETETGKCDEQKCRQKVMQEFFKRVIINHVVSVYI